jgi:hypothetical protein
MISAIYSRHARRRMKLYGIAERDIEEVCVHGTKSELPDGRVAFIWNIAERYRYPLKVVGTETDEGFLVVTAYPLKGTKRDGEI